MIHRHLSAFDVTLPAIGQGMSGMGTRDGHSPDRLKARKAAIRAGIERGLTYFDTANTYGGGFSEEVVGEAVRGIRPDCFIASKFHPSAGNPAQSVRDAVHGSLRRLGTDYIDLYQIHWPNPKVRLEEVMPALEQVVREGLVRFIGVSNFGLTEFREAQRCLGERRIFSNQVPFNLLEQDDVAAFTPLGDGERPLLIGYSPLNEGRLAATHEQMGVLEEIAHGRGRSAAQIAMAWVISHLELVCVTKTSSVQHIEELADAMDIVLTADEKHSISRSGGLGVQRISPEDIELRGAPGRPFYRSREEALRNELDLFPSPEELAIRFARHEVVLPLRLIQTSGPQERPKYATDEYDVFGQVRRYWGWVLAHGDESIPAYVVPERRT